MKGLLKRQSNERKRGIAFARKTKQKFCHWNRIFKPISYFFHHQNVCVPQGKVCEWTQKFVNERKNIEIKSPWLSFFLFHHKNISIPLKKMETFILGNKKICEWKQKHWFFPLTSLIFSSPELLRSPEKHFFFLIKPFVSEHKNARFLCETQRLMQKPEIFPLPSIWTCSFPRDFTSVAN